MSTTTSTWSQITQRISVSVYANTCFSIYRWVCMQLSCFRLMSDTNKNLWGPMWKYRTRKFCFEQGVSCVVEWVTFCFVETLVVHLCVYLSLCVLIVFACLHVFTLFSSIRQKDFFSFFSGTSNWSGDYFIDTCGVGYIINQTAIITHGTHPMDTVQGQLQAVFNRDWHSTYAKPVPLV